MSTVRRLLPKEFLNLVWHLPRAVFAACWFRFPAKRLTCVAIAGTKGKTTTAILTARMLTAAGHRTACVSTAVVRAGGPEELNTLKMTTPSAWWINAFLRRAVDSGCTHAVLEVSSHALLQHRTFGIPFTAAVLTNLMPDHLEYHRDAREYQETHRKLCTPSLRALILNGDDEHLQSFACTGITTRTFSTHGALADRIRALPPALLGEHNIANATAAATGAESLEVSWDAIAAALRDPAPVPGRLERITAGQSFTVLVDYAHSPESLTSAIDAITPLVRDAPHPPAPPLPDGGGETTNFSPSPREGEREWLSPSQQRGSGSGPPPPNRGGAGGGCTAPCRGLHITVQGVGGRIITVFGACGERDPKRRPPMGAVLDARSDIVIVTNDDPYGEDPEQIAEGLLSGMSKKTRDHDLFVILDRRAAIAKACALAVPGDLVLIAGKGAEQWQVFKDRKVPWDDRTVAREEIAKVRR